MANVPSTLTPMVAERVRGTVGVGKARDLPEGQRPPVATSTTTVEGIVMMFACFTDPPTESSASSTATPSLSCTSQSRGR